MKKEMNILLIVRAFFMLAGGLFGPIYAIFVEHIGGDLVTAGTAYGIYYILAGILIYVVSKFEDRMNNQEFLIVIGYFINSVGYLGYLYISEPLHLYVVQMIFGIGAAVNVPAFKGVFSHNLDRGKFDSEWGLWDGMSYFFWGISAFIGGYIAKIYGFEILFFIMLCLSVIGLIISTRLFFIKKRK